MFLYKSATSAEKSAKRTLVMKHGSHNQKTHAGSRGGGAGGASSGGKNAKKVNDALQQAAQSGLDKESVNEIKTAYESKDRKTLTNLEAGYFEAAVGRHGMTAGEKNADYYAHTAVVRALQEIDGDSEENDWQTMDESGDF